MEFFPNRMEHSLNSVNSANSGNLINHWSMNGSQFKVAVCCLCFPGTSYTKDSRFKWSNLFYKNVYKFCRFYRIYSGTRKSSCVAARGESPVVKQIKPWPLWGEWVPPTQVPVWWEGMSPGQVPVQGTLLPSQQDLVRQDLNSIASLSHPSRISEQGCSTTEHWWCTN